MEDTNEPKFTSKRRYTQQEGGLAGVGGGAIPNGGAPIGHGSAPEAGENVKDVDSTATDQGNHLNNINASDMSDEGAPGGRSPDQANKNIGDRDRPREQSGIENGPIDPMTSRAPDKIDGSAKQ